MAHFSNGTEGEMYQERYCFKCRYWDDDRGCPIWFLHELHVGEKEWQPVLDALIPMEPFKGAEGIVHTFAGECVTYDRRGREREAPMTPGQREGLRAWKGGGA